MLIRPIVEKNFLHRAKQKSETQKRHVKRSRQRFYVICRRAISFPKRQHNKIYTVNNFAAQASQF